MLNTCRKSDLLQEGLVSCSLPSAPPTDGEGKDRGIEGHVSKAVAMASTSGLGGLNIIYSFLI